MSVWMCAFWCVTVFLLFVTVWRLVHRVEPDWDTSKDSQEKKKGGTRQAKEGDLCLHPLVVHIIVHFSVFYFSLYVHLYLICSLVAIFFLWQAIVE